MILRGPLGLAITLILAAAGVSCSGRERTNPFDPANDETGGEPRSLRAVAGCHRVDLEWDRLEMRDIEGFRIWREAADGPGAPGVLLTDPGLDAEVTAYADTTLANETVAAYRVEFVFPGNPAAFTTAATARPGSALVWCSDPCGWGLSLLAPDAGQIRGTLAYGSPILDLDIDSAGHRVFAASISLPAAVLVVSSLGADSVAQIPLAGPSAVSWSAREGALAVASFYERRVDWVRPDGQAIFSFDCGPWYPEDVAFRGMEQTWIALSSGGLEGGLLVRVHVSSGTCDTLAEDLGRPVAVVDDPSGPGCWVADRSGAVLFVSDALAGTRTAAGTFRGPTDVEADGRGNCWVADPEAGLVARIDRHGQLLDAVAGWAGVRGVSYDSTTASLWIALPDQGRICRLAAAGEVGTLIGSGAVPGCPQKVAGDWLGGCVGGGFHGLP